MNIRKKIIEWLLKDEDSIEYLVHRITHNHMYLYNKLIDRIVNDTEVKETIENVVVGIIKGDTQSWGFFGKCESSSLFMKIREAVEYIMNEEIFKGKRESMSQVEAYIKSEEFLDAVIDRIRRKQLQ